MPVCPSCDATYNGVAPVYVGGAWGWGMGGAAPVQSGVVEAGRQRAAACGRQRAPRASKPPSLRPRGRAPHHAPVLTLNLAFRSAPRSTSSAATASWPPCAAANSGVVPLLFLAFTSAPRASRSVTAARLPASAASISSGPSAASAGARRRGRAGEGFAWAARARRGQKGERRKQLRGSRQRRGQQREQRHGDQRVARTPGTRTEARPIKHTRRRGGDSLPALRRRDIPHLAIDRAVNVCAGAGPSAARALTGAGGPRVALRGARVACWRVAPAARRDAQRRASARTRTRVLGRRAPVFPALHRIATPRNPVEMLTDRAAPQRGHGASDAGPRRLRRAAERHGRPRTHS